MTTEMLLFKEETFGPIAPFMKFKNDDDVLSLANDTEYGLASYILQIIIKEFNAFQKNFRLAKYK